MVSSLVPLLQLTSEGGTAAVRTTLTGPYSSTSSSTLQFVPSSNTSVTAD